MKAAVNKALIKLLDEMDRTPRLRPSSDYCPMTNDQVGRIFDARDALESIVGVEMEPIGDLTPLEVLCAELAKSETV